MRKPKSANPSSPNAAPKVSFWESPPLPAETVTLTKPDFIAAALAAVFALIVYLITLAPTVTGDDSGEFLAAAHTMGICHPPGYPLWTMLAKLFTLIAPVGSIESRIAFVSSFFGAATCFVVTLLVIKLTANRIAGFVAAAALAVSLEFWKWNVVAETYSLNAFLTVLGMLFLLYWYESRHTKYLYYFAAAYGLGLCNHHTMHFMGPVFALFIISVDRRFWRNWRVYRNVTVIALADPYVNFLGDSVTFERFWGLVTRKQYMGGLVAEPRTVSRFIMQCWAFLNQYASQFTILLAWLPVLGIAPLWRRNRYALGLIFGTFVYVALGLIIAINGNFDKGSIWLNSKFWLPAYVMAAILIGVALHWMTSLKAGKMVAAVAAVAVIVVPFITHYNTNNKSNYYFTQDLAHNLDITLAPNAYYFPNSDHAAFAIYYLQVIENKRPDITIVTKYGDIEKSVNDIIPLEYRNSPWKGPSDDGKLAIGSWLLYNTDRPVYYSAYSAGAKFHNAKMFQTGLLAQMVPPDFQPPERDYWSEYSWHTLDENDTHRDYTAESLLSDYHFSRGREYIEKGDSDNARTEFEIAARIAGPHPVLLSNIGSACGENQFLDLAKDCFTKALEINPRDRKALRNLGIVCASLGTFDEAAENFDRLVKLNEEKYGRNHPLVAAALNNVGGALISASDLDTAYQYFMRALRIDKACFGPDHPNTARDENNLAIVLRDQGQKKLKSEDKLEEAQRLFEEAQQYQTQAIQKLQAGLGPQHPFTQLAQQGAFIEGLDN